ncbi:MAG: hypothetical protein QM777_08740 [Pseudorhodoferax sp.]
MLDRIEVAPGVFRRVQQSRADEYSSPRTLAELQRAFEGAR